MIYFVCAFYQEADVIIKRYNLKRVNEAGFQVFQGKGIKLVISGIGKVNSAVAGTYLLSKYNTGEDIVLNIGICGEAGKVGQAVLINRIIDMDTDREFFPDIIVKHPFKEGTLKTFSKPVAQSQSGFCDMEGSGFFQAASKFLSPNRIQLIKVVSDNFNGERLNRDFVANLIGRHLDDIHDYIAHMQRAYEKEEPIDSWDIKLIEDISQNLNLTESQRSLFKRVYFESKLRNGFVPDSIKQFINVRVEIKNESKRELTRLIDILSK